MISSSRMLWTIPGCEAELSQCCQAVPTAVYGDPNIRRSLRTLRRPFCGHREGRVRSSHERRCQQVLVPPRPGHAGKHGTNWWEEVFGSAFVGNYDLDISGGGDDNSYRASFNYFDQGGTAQFNRFRRGSVRVNTSFNRGKLNFGENIAIAVHRHHGGLTDDPDGYAEDGILGKNILMQPVIPVYDINGNYAGGKCCGLGTIQSSENSGRGQKTTNKGTSRFRERFCGLRHNAADKSEIEPGFNSARNHSPASGRSSPRTPRRRSSTPSTRTRIDSRIGP